MKLIRLFLLVCGLVIMIGVVAICTPTSSAASKPLLDMSWEEIEEQAKNEGSVVLWSWSNEVKWNEVGDVFEEMYGVKFDVMISDKNTGLAKIMAEKNAASGTIDVINIPGDILNIISDSNVLYGTILPLMENADFLDPGLSKRKEGVTNNDRWVPIQLEKAGLFYNPKRLSYSDRPQTWEDLENWIDANPKKFGQCLPEKGGTGQAFMEAIIAATTGGIEQYMNDTELDPDKLAKWDAAWDWIISRKDKITLTNSNNDSLTRLNQGEIDLCVAWNGTVVSNIEAGELFKDPGYYVPEFGLVNSGEVVSILKNAPHPAASLLLINFMSSEVGQQLFIDLWPAFPAKIDMDLPNVVLEKDTFKYNTEWMPSIYKAYYIKEFTKRVLMN